jgi:hypothetical protein
MPIFSSSLSNSRREQAFQWSAPLHGYFCPVPGASPRESVELEPGAVERGALLQVRESGQEAHVHRLLSGSRRRARHPWDRLVVFSYCQLWSSTSVARATYACHRPATAASLRNLALSAGAAAPLAARKPPSARWATARSGSPLLAARAGRWRLCLREPWSGLPAILALTARSLLTKEAVCAGWSASEHAGGCV